MAEIYTWDCPYCYTRSVAFTISTVVQSRQYPGVYDDNVAVCGKCGRAVVATFVNGRLFKITPAPPEPPKYLPDNVQNYFRQGVDNLSGNYDAAGSMFRKALDIGLKERFPDNEKKTFTTLKARIKEAANSGDLTADLAAWANEIRVGGNEAVHDQEPFSKEDAQELHDFTELVLLYLFTLPGMLERAQERRESDAKAP